MFKDGPLLASIINSVETQFDYLEKVDDQMLFLELIPLHHFLVSTPPVYTVLKDALILRADLIKDFEAIDRETSIELRRLKVRFVEMYADIDDSDYQLNDSPLDLRYTHTFARFDNLLNGVKMGIDRGQPVEAPSQYDNRSSVKAALEILSAKYDQKRREISDDAPDALNDFYFDLSNLSQLYNHRFKSLVNQLRVSLGESALFLENVITGINPEPVEMHSFEDLMKAGQDEPFSLAPLVYKPIQDTVYSNAAPNEHWISIIRQHLKRLRYGVIGGLLENQSHGQVVSRFKTRCMWYDKVRVRNLVTDDRGKLIRAKEDTLVQEMARYLYDNGYPVIFHVQTENLQSDLMDPTARAALFIEGKAYTHACKEELIKGIAQLHGYLNNFETNYYRIRDGYFVVFRLDGPIYDFPDEIVTNRYRIIPIVIDLGDSKVSGRKQAARPVIISKDEVIKVIDSK